MRAISATADIAATPQQLWAVPAGLDAHPPQPNPFTRPPSGPAAGGRSAPCGWSPRRAGPRPSGRRRRPLSRACRRAGSAG
jgi:hypothetical protein